MNTQKEIPLILGGGGITGLCRLAGSLLALDALGIHYTQIHGTSAGAIAGAFLATGHSPLKFANIITSLRDEDLREKRFLWQLRLFRLDHIFKTQKIKDILDFLLPTSFYSLRMPLFTWAVKADTGDLINTMSPGISETPAQAVLASMSVPCIFPPVKLLDGHTYVDGGLRSNVPMVRNWRDYEKVYVVIPSDRPHDYKGRNNILTAAIRAMNIKQNDEKVDLVESMADESNVVVLWPDVATDKGMMHLDHTLIEKCYHWTLNELKQRAPKP